MFWLDIKVNQSQRTSMRNHVLLVPVMSELTVDFHESFNYFSARGYINTHNRFRWLCNPWLLKSPDFQTSLKAIVMVVFEHPVKCKHLTGLHVWKLLSVKWLSIFKSMYVSAYLCKHMYNLEVAWENIVVLLLSMSIKDALPVSVVCSFWGHTEALSTKFLSDSLQISIWTEKSK